jgi:hypothetical protein
MSSCETFGAGGKCRRGDHASMRRRVALDAYTGRTFGSQDTRRPGPWVSTSAGDTVLQY